MKTVNAVSYAECTNQEEQYLQQMIVTYITTQAYVRYRITG